MSGVPDNCTIFFSVRECGTYSIHAHDELSIEWLRAIHKQGSDQRFFYWDGANLEETTVNRWICLVDSVESSMTGFMAWYDVKERFQNTRREQTKPVRLVSIEAAKKYFDAYFKRMVADGHPFELVAVVEQTKQGEN